MPQKEPLLSLSGLLNHDPKSSVARNLFQTADSILGFNELNAFYKQVPYLNDSEFFERSLQLLGIRFKQKKCLTTEGKLLSRKRGLLIVSNHPSGAVEVLISMAYFRQYFPNIKLVGNRFFQCIQELQDDLIPVMPFKDSQAYQANIEPVRQMIGLLNKKQVLLTYPASNVSTLNLRSLSIRDPQWHSSVARIAKLTQSDVLPVFVHCKNRAYFYAIGPHLHALAYVRELLAKKNQTIEISIGNLLRFDEYQRYKTDHELIQYFRNECEQLNR